LCPLTLTLAREVFKSTIKKVFVWSFIYIDGRWAECKSGTIAEVDSPPCINAIRSFYKLAKEEEVDVATCVVKKGDTMNLRHKTCSPIGREII